MPTKVTLVGVFLRYNYQERELYSFLNYLFYSNLGGDLCIVRTSAQPLK